MVKTYSLIEVRKATLEYFSGDELSTDVWIKKYCLKDSEGNFYELTPDDMHWRLAYEIYRIECKYPNALRLEEIFDSIKNFKRIVPQGSPMSGIGNDFQVVSISNCFVVGAENDSYGGIMKIDQDVAQLEKRRGGVGTDLSFIRPAGSPVKNSAITSTGVVPFMERFSNTTKEVAQDGRRGALMLSISTKHPDAEAFIDAKLTQGKVTGANVSVKIDDEFMKSVLDGLPYLQQFPIDALIPKYSKIGNASNIWKKIIHNAWKSAEPGILFWDNIIRESIPDCYSNFGFKTTSTNPCFSGKENLLTIKGNQSFEELCDLDGINIINSIGNVVSTKVWCSGEKETISLHDTQKNIITCTPDHIWKTSEGLELAAKNLLNKKLSPFLLKSKSHDELYVKLGFIQGDGTLGRLKSTAHRGLEINIGKNDDDVLSYFNLTRESDKQRTFYVNDYNNICKELKFSDEQLPKRNLPLTINDWTDQQQLSFLSGLFSANGSIIANYRISLKSTSIGLINEVQKLLKKFDIDSYYTTNKSKKVLFNNGEYTCKESYDLNIGKYYDLIKFYNNIGFIHQYKIDKLHKVIILRAPKITKIVNNGVIKVYDFIEPETHWGVVNGCISHNCGEIPLCPYDSCRLVAINLYNYVIEPFTKRARFDLVAFKADVNRAMRYMDDIVDLEIEKIDKILEKIKSDPEDEFIKLYEIDLWEKIKEKAVDGRRTGLGITGMGDMLAALGFTYGTDLATDFAESIVKELKLGAYRTSVTLAKERGAFPIYDAKLEENNSFILRIKDEDIELYNDMIKYGRRNIALLTISPTGTVSLMTKTTSGIEPVFLPIYKRRRKINPAEKNTRVDFTDAEGVAWAEYPVFHHNLTTWFIANGYDMNVIKTLTVDQIEEFVKTSPYYKATSNDVDWVKKVEMQGRIQRHIDHSISVTVNLPENTTEETVAKVYETGWKSGCKGITVYRDGSRDGVLISASTKEQTAKEITFKENNAPKRPKRIKGDIIRFQNNLEKWIAVVGIIDGRPYELFTGRNENGLSNLPPYVKECEIVKNILEDGSKRYDIEYIDLEGKKCFATGISHQFNPEYWNYAKLISSILRHGMPLIYIYELIESLNLNSEHLNTWKNGVARVIKRYIKDGVKVKGTCEECGSTDLEFIEGCMTCVACGSSKCS